MNDTVQFVLKHGYPILFAALFARQIGLPVPAPLFLLAVGQSPRTQADALFCDFSRYRR